MMESEMCWDSCVTCVTSKYKSIYKYFCINPYMYLHFVFHIFKYFSKYLTPRLYPTMCQKVISTLNRGRIQSLKELIDYLEKDCYPVLSTMQEEVLHKPLQKYRWQAPEQEVSSCAKSLAAVSLS